MKKALSFIAVAASLLLASGARAQGTHVRADVPFEFVAANTMYAAGTYDIQAASESNRALKLSSDKMAGTFIIPQACASVQPAKKTVLVFHRIGDEYFLYQIWTAGSDRGRELPQPKRETELARNSTVEEVVIAANLVK